MNKHSRRTSGGRVAIVHDYLNQPGGAERVVLEMAGLWPDAPIYTSLYRPKSTFPGFMERDVRTSPLNRLPVDRRFRALAPFYPMAFRSFGRLSNELVISSSSGWAHGVRTGAETTHIVYCYAPARWLYRSERYFRSQPLRRRLADPLSALFRRWDRNAARRADGYISIAENVQRRVEAAYGVQSDVVYPPVDVHRFAPKPRGDRLLVVSRLLPYKRIDLPVLAATRAGIGLDVVGTGPTMRALQALAGPSVKFHGSVDDLVVKEMMEGCRAVFMPGEEDFGIVPVEANAAGKPAIVYAGGGALETMIEGKTAAYFREHSVESITAAIHAVDRIDTEPARLAEYARRFSPESFRIALLEAVQSIMVKHQAGREYDNYDTERRARPHQPYAVR